MEKALDRVIFDKDFYKQVGFATKSDGDYFVDKIDTLKIGKKSVIDKIKKEVISDRTDFFNMIMQHKDKINLIKEKLKIKKLYESREKLEEKIRKLAINTIGDDNDEFVKELNKEKENKKIDGDIDSSVSTDSVKSNKSFNRNTMVMGDIYSIKSNASQTATIEQINLYNELKLMVKGKEFCSKDTKKINDLLEKYKDYIN